MDEEIKREIEILEKELKEEDKKTSSSEVQKKASSNFIAFLGIGVSLILILLGIVFFYKVFIAKEKASEKIASKEKVEERSTLENQTLNQTVYYSKERVKFSVSDFNYPYKLELKNFLVSLDAKNFLKLDIIFYFERDTELKTAINNELIYRDFIFRFLGSIEAKNWKEERYVKELEKKLLHEMEKRGLKPLPKAIQLDGLLLKA